ncbi:hypothetical protein H9L10_01400 [Phycicoccus endophyticus]|uniref:GH26 domain-containing protein n=1 Tax=Phycicoccus endophyticus TaxID=1690220 RepID=A0A7G9R2F6_9MICO|nr:glycosyl hydrolase [Phycicoccus endophyticus]NHI20835.1 hypothetical protein [Phycicoccus endophyticus]QNN49781.1 hypothetical protein H9L10_01400 [Phycicoccus endophyticus]GGL35101.1 hypothetical protein GCM10012283_16890 [Phycicoccus endophyticus]
MSATLVPSCGAWWGVSTPTGTDGVAAFERMTGARTDIYHGYHRIGQMFPTSSEIALANDPTGHRYLLLSLMPTTRHTWAQVAAGAEDAYLNRLARHIRSTYNKPFFLTIHHEPENDVVARAGSGMQAKDFRAMFRHVVHRLRNRGVDNAVFVVNFQGTQKFHLEKWWPTMYPGDDVVDWIAWDSYSCVKPKNGPCRDFAGMMNVRFSKRSPWPGMYNYMSSHHGNKPFMVAEFGVYNTHDKRKAAVIRSALSQASSFPKVKAIAYWNSGTRRLARVTPGSTAATALSRWASSSLFRQQVP